ncbi:hypothetical protein BU16DRAFT_526437 [Lophium mytilinum]|uniref:Uncharacterized protein n=1 Tax=Lophium mytilinum TaxID=390894 RepID=A0A6A6QXU7_9PEZI|nr:hypothetical protein BU16DRAFT_526437 [Lophium mytilinum]
MTHVTLTSDVGRGRKESQRHNLVVVKKWHGFRFAKQTLSLRYLAQHYSSLQVLTLHLRFSTSATQSWVCWMPFASDSESSCVSARLWMR